MINQFQYTSRIPLLLSAVFMVCSSPLAAQEAKPTEAEVSIEAAPEAFKKILPQSIEELRQMQKHVVAIAPKLKECTVNLRIGRAQGSGVIVSADGLVLTAAHVAMRPGLKVKVILDDGNEYTGTTLGMEVGMDAGMLQIESDRKDWPHRPVYKGKQVELGAWCISLGHPAGRQEERGQVLRLGRVISRTSWMIQSDCEMIGGDSGGPLFNMKGEVIGINSRVGEGTKYNFHVSSEVFHQGWDRMLASERFRTKAYLGVSGSPHATGKGMVITKVYPSDPAAKAGVRDGDVLIKFGREEIESLDQLIELVGKQPVGRTIVVEIIRGEKTLKLPILLEPRWD